MIVSERLRAELVSFSVEKAPQEACGLLSGPSPLSSDERDQDDLYCLWRAENAAADPLTSFLIHPHEQTELLRQIWSRHEELVGVFHSHPRSGPEPSDRDRAIAAAIESMRPRRADPLIWVIVGRGQCGTCNGWQWVEQWADHSDVNGEHLGSEAIQVPCPHCEDGEQPALWVGPLP